MKKIAAILLTILMTASLAACGNSGQEKNDASSAKTEEKTRIPNRNQRIPKQRNWLLAQKPPTLQMRRKTPMMLEEMRMRVGQMF